ARQWLDEDALRKPELDRRARAFIAGFIARRQRQHDLDAGPWMIRQILGGLTRAIARAQLRQHQREVRRAVERTRHTAVSAGLFLQREVRLCGDDAVIVLDLV